MTQGNGKLVLPAVQSPNFVHSVSGWTINKDGSAEFNNLTIRGTFFGTEFIINANGAFFYAPGAPAAGNLVISICPAATTDPFGANVNAGIEVINNTFGTVALLASGSLQFFAGVNQLISISSSGFKLFNTHSAVIFFVEQSKDAWFLYADTGTATQGALIASSASAAGTDDFGNAFDAGLATYVTDPSTSDLFAIDLGIVATGFGGAQHPGIAIQNKTHAFFAAPNVVAVGRGTSFAELALNSGAHSNTAAQSLIALEDDGAGTTGGIIAAQTGLYQVLLSGGAANSAKSTVTLPDGITYRTEHLTLRLASSFSINSITAQNIFSIILGAAGNYEVDIWAVTLNATAADAAGFAFGFTGTLFSALVDFESLTTGTATVGYGASATLTTQFNGQGTGGNQRVLIHADIAASTSGVLTFTGKELVAANAVTMFAGSRMTIRPV